MALKQKLRSSWTTSAGIIWLVLWLALINPTTSQPLLLLVPFVLIVFLLHRLVLWLVRQVSTSTKLNQRQIVLSWFASILAGVLLVLSSLGQLGWRDGLTLLAISIIGLVYIVKLVPNERP